jgi:peroxiredoxin family protein
MKIGIIVSSNDTETVWNAFRLGNYALTMGDMVKVFLLGKGVESESLDTDKFKVTEQMRAFITMAEKYLPVAGVLRFVNRKVRKYAPYHR